MSHRLGSRARWGERPVTIAHRGGGIFAPENTIEAIRAGAAQGADLVEIDARLAGDGRLVLAHDEAAPDAVASLPALAEALAGATTLGVGVNLELKATPGGSQSGRQLVLAVARLVHEHGRDLPVLVSSFDHQVLAELRAEAPSLATGVLTSERPADPMGLLRELDADAYHPAFGGGRSAGAWSPARSDDRLLAQALRRDGFHLHVWTVNDPAAASACLDHGATGIITDRPDLLHALIARAWAPGMAYARLRDAGPWRELPGCPGRSVWQDSPDVSPSRLAGGAPARIFQVAGAPDPVHVIALADGGLISYRKPDGRFVHTLNTPEGFARKLDELGIPLEHGADSIDRGR